MDVTAREQAQPSLLRDMVMLTKPRIISLLLVTTVAPMFVAGNPGWLLCLIVLVGGYLMAGGANAVNMYLDRDIDTQMARTRLRPIPSGRMGARSVLAFGIALATAATFLLARFTNVLTAVLALAGFYFYVFVYTRGLKRTTPQNIVIGGAAGAFPPLVGWASMTGSIDLTAVYLFLIIFYWTPPHFLALALLKQKHYGRAGIPMAPLGRLLPRIRPYIWRLVVAFVCLVASASIALAFPQIVRHLLDAAFISANGDLLNKIALGLLALFAIQALLNFVQVYFLTSTSELVIAQLREDLFAHLVRLSPGFFTERRTGELTSRLSADTTVLQTVLSYNLSEFARQTLFLIGGIILLVITDSRLTATTLAVVPLVV